MAPSGGQAGEIDKLKSLLFSPEAARLDAAEAQIEGLQGRVGDARRLETATAEILVEAFRRAEIARHRELAAAVAPVVVAAIRSEIHNSRDMMVEALYPITGRLVSAAVANAFRELVEGINQRLDRLLSTSQWKMRLQSWFSGRPMAEIALAQARAPVFRRIFLFERGSGRLLANWRLDKEREDNPELIGGMIAAISEFAANVLADQRGELRTLDLGGSKVFLRASTRIILAAELIGELRRKAQERLDRTFLDLVDRQERGELVENADLAALAEDLRDEGISGARRPWRLRVAVAAAIIVGLLGFFLDGPIQRWRKTTAIATAFEQGLAAEPALGPYPLHIDIDHPAGRVVLRGLVGSQEQTDALIAKLRPAAAPYEVTADVGILATAAALSSTRQAIDGRLADVATRLTGLDEKLVALTDATKTTTAETTASGTEKLNTLRREIADGLKAQNAASDALASEIEGAKAASDARFESANAKVAALENSFAATAQQLKVESARNVDDLATRIAALQAGLADSSQRLKTETASDLQVVSARLGALEAALATASQRIDSALGELSSPHRRLLEIAAQSAVFFDDDDNFADPEAAARTLDALAPVIIASKEGLRIVGHADATGGPSINAQLSHRRAEKVADLLRERGVPANALVVVARGAQESIAVVARGIAQVNRRVTFEPLLNGERGR
jgi:outer membrane protein OmpA-like peptidoglycan-associated protein